MILRFFPVAVLLVLALSCGSPPDPGALPVAELPGKTLTVAELNAYLEANLFQDDQTAAEDPEARKDQDRVKSRLFDTFLDEELLYLEARRREIAVGEDEIDAYLAAGGEDVPAASTADERRAVARRDLAIQKVREAWIRSRVRVTPDEVDAYVVQNLPSVTPERHLLLRSLRLASDEQANKVRSALAAKRMTFDEAVVSSGAGPGQGDPLEVDLESLPADVQAAVAPLKPGEVSGPVVVQGSTYLFFVAEWRTGDQDEESLRARARDGVLRKKYEEASQELIDGLRKKASPRIHLENLPFPYVPDEAR